jgi:hypothetical protein
MGLRHEIVEANWAPIRDFLLAESDAAGRG